MVIVAVLLCPVRPGDSNEELRHAARSWETNLILPGGLELWTIGYKPSWLKPDWHIDGNEYSSAPLSVFDNVLKGALAAEAEGLSEVIYMNDDFFCLDPVGAILPVRRDCSLAQHIGSMPAQAGTWWPRSLRLTASWLAEQGYDRPHSYEVHRPLVANPTDMVNAISKWPYPLSDNVPQWRTVYGTLNEVEAHPVRDAKLSHSQPGIGTPWISTSDQSWRRYAPQLRTRFQKPSRWEVD